MHTLLKLLLYLSMHLLFTIFACDEIVLAFVVYFLMRPSHIRNLFWIDGSFCCFFCHLVFKHCSILFKYINEGFLIEIHKFSIVILQKNTSLKLSPRHLFSLKHTQVGKGNFSTCCVVCSHSQQQAHWSPP